MGHEASYQAIPEDCELLKLARQDREIAEDMQSFHFIAERGFWSSRIQEGSKEHEFTQMVIDLVKDHPGLVQRYFYAGGRSYDIVHYLLSPSRRDLESTRDEDQTLIKFAIYGSERLHPDAAAGQGRPIGFVPAELVRTIADYMEKITFEQFGEHFDPVAMDGAFIYKFFIGHYPDPNDYVRYAWEEFQGMCDIYRAAADCGEAMITIMD